MSLRDAVVEAVDFLRTEAGRHGDTRPVMRMRCEAHADNIAEYVRLLENTLRAARETIRALDGTGGIAPRHRS